MRVPLLALTLVLSAAQGSAQSTGRQSPLIGPFGGLNLATFGGDDAGDVDQMTGFQSGLFGRFALTRHLVLVPALTFSRQGANLGSTSPAPGAIKLSYLEFPLLVRLSIPAGQRVRPYVEAGPAVAYKLGCTRDVKQQQATVGFDCDFLLLNTRKVELSTHFGAGLELHQFFVGARYRLGLSSIDDSNNELDIKNRVLAFVAGYGFRVGH